MGLYSLVRLGTPIVLKQYKYKDRKIYFISIVCILFILISSATFPLQEHEKELKKINNRLQIEKNNILKLDIQDKNLEKNLKSINKELNFYKIKLKKVNNKQNKLLDKIKILEKEKNNIEHSLLNKYNNKNEILNILVALSWKNQEKDLTFNLIQYIRENILMDIKYHKKNLNIANKKEKELNFKNAEFYTDINLIRKEINKNQILLDTYTGDTIISAIDRKEINKSINEISMKAKRLKDLIDKLSKKSLPKAPDTQKIEKFNYLIPVKKQQIIGVSLDKYNKGLLVKVKPESTIITPNKGLVVYANFFKGYGQLVILDLGNSYHLVISGLEEIQCLVGDWLDKGELIGSMGSLTENKSLYIEIRYKGKTLNPNKWLLYTKSKN